MAKFTVNKNRLDPYKGFKFLVEKIVPNAKRDDILLPEKERALLDQVVEQLRDSGERSKPGVNALFSGEKGTGRKMAAEVIAEQLGLEMYRVDLSTVDGKYIGETEKNLSQLFDAATAEGAVLYFEEADALFGKRSEVKDSRDRYANIETNYLLQRLEDYEGVAILATSRKKDIDEAFLRRIRFVVNFPKS